MQTNDDEMTMTKAQTLALMEQCGNRFVELYTKLCEELDGELDGEFDEEFVFAAMAAALGICAMEAGVGNDSAMKLLTSIFDEAKEAARIKNTSTMFDAEIDIGQHAHHWRVVKCDGSDWDTVECSKCGRQQRARCNFDDEYA